MLNQYLPVPGVPGVCFHNTSKWQVTEMMGGLAAEILCKKARWIDDEGRKSAGNLELHDCYPRVFLQGDEAHELLDNLQKAKAKLSDKAVDSLMLDDYELILALS